MVKRRKISDFSESCPQFFKVYLPKQSSHRMRIPPDFVKYITRALPYKSTITSLEKRSWHVELKKVDGHLYLEEGWQQFVHDNSLQFGDFLLFYYGDNAQFYVKIYGKDGCQKKVSRPTKEIFGETTHPQDNQTVKRRKSKQLAQGANDVEIAQKELFPRFPSAIQEGSRARKETNKFVSEFPFFEVVMRPSYISGSPMNIPSSFHNRYMEKGRHGALLVISDRSWPVKLSKTVRGARSFLHEIEYPLGATHGEESNTNHKGNSQEPNREEREEDDCCEILADYAYQVEIPEGDELRMIDAAKEVKPFFTGDMTNYSGRLPSAAANGGGDDGGNISLTKIESRPHRNRPIRLLDDAKVGTAKHFEYMFYVNFEASMAEPRAQNALAEVQEFTSFLRVLGSYPMDMTSWCPSHGD
ncbi:hypothetical protein Vadar_005604 [Vaccinium darrowii]|uniref:Uncharacterized protein n=1 Tax=Vaccinium darrowii TaxID=229202 RepID=A0ACB7YBN5_9ERIC|nr:hypothetical protein Vadar_005604 [Vaccinium darrowii]